MAERVGGRLVATTDAGGKDEVVRTFNTATKQLAAVNINSYLGKEKDKVTLAVLLASLPDGVSYPAEAIDVDRFSPGLAQRDPSP